MLPLEGKTVAMTGAAGGIGSAVARRLQSAGAVVTGIDRVECPACDASIVTDLGDRAALALLCARLGAAPPDILVNVAGVLGFGLHERQTAEALALCYTINLIVPATLAAAVAGPMRARGSGQIVNIGSVLGAIPYPWFAAYSSSKAGLAALSQALRRELAGSAVALTHINPRAARTAFNSAEVNRFLALSGMKADDPEWLADRIAAAIIARRKTVSIGWAEKVFAALNALAPSLVDRGLAGSVRKVGAQLS
ncbi:SDR family NAD(P)-dependent oxidoreductase [Novosphingobium lentum]|uniref:SDR family NAD(P)-dependent oxidoreductase n=1 Tax=Novosphingobium lentum TaxID=145287 RepID=UPI000A06AF72|nr:SDR family NAD(P)-dependent oxidoreductase [Novosphingobium lentum]